MVGFVVSDYLRDKRATRPSCVEPVKGDVPMRVLAASLARGTNEALVIEAFYVSQVFQGLKELGIVPDVF